MLTPKQQLNRLDFTEEQKHSAYVSTCMIKLLYLPMSWDKEEI